MATSRVGELLLTVRDRFSADFGISEMTLDRDAETALRMIENTLWSAFLLPSMIACGLGRTSTSSPGIELLERNVSYPA